ncbi:MAG TPA: hypothetical protein VMG09_08730 [Bacteroidota bacterium]|nr:hypothetical protein [Bacteroidota bacterium]
MRYLDRIAIIVILFFLSEDALAAGRHASIVFRDSTKVIAEIISLEDSTLTMTNVRSDVRNNTRKSSRDTVHVQMDSLSRIKLFGRGHALEGAGIGAAIGGLIGAYIGNDAARNAQGDPTGVGLARLAGTAGGLLLGMIGGFFVGVVVGGNNVTENYDLDPGQPDDLAILKGLLEQDARRMR